MMRAWRQLGDTESASITLTSAGQFMFRAPRYDSMEEVFIVLVETEYKRSKENRNDKLREGAEDEL